MPGQAQGYRHDDAEDQHGNHELHKGEAPTASAALPMHKRGHEAATTTVRLMGAGSCGPSTVTVILVKSIDFPPSPCWIHGTHHSGHPAPHQESHDQAENTLPREPAEPERAAPNYGSNESAVKKTRMVAPK